MTRVEAGAILFAYAAIGIGALVLGISLIWRRKEGNDGR